MMIMMLMMLMADDDDDDEGGKQGGRLPVLLCCCVVVSPFGSSVRTASEASLLIIRIYVKVPYSSTVCTPTVTFRWRTWY